MLLSNIGIVGKTLNIFKNSYDKNITRITEFEPALGNKQHIIPRLVLKPKPKQAQKHYARFLI